MEYIIRMQTVVETPSWLKKAEALFSAEEREGIVAMVSSDPECGDLIQGTGDFGRSGLAAAECENALERGSFTFSVTRAFPYSLWPPMQRMRKKA
jgi:hypothetical protein